MRYFFDTYALIEILKENPAYKAYAEQEIVTSILNIGEFHYALLRDFNKRVAGEWSTRLGKVALGVDKDTVVRAMEFRFYHRKKSLSFVDCAGYILAKERGMKFLTGDEDFRDIPNVEFVKK